MAAKTPIVKQVSLNGVDVNVHACPWPLYRRIYGAENGTAETLALIEEVVRECVVPASESDRDLDVVGSCSRPQISRLFELAVSEEEVPKPDF